MSRTIVYGSKAGSKGKLSTKPVSTVEDILQNSLIALEELGWCKGTLQDKQTGAVCMLGAIDVGTADHGIRTIKGAETRIAYSTKLGKLRGEARERVMRAIPLAIARRKKIAKARVMALWGEKANIASYNDSKDSKFDIVKEAFRIALNLK